MQFAGDADLFLHANAHMHARYTHKANVALHMHLYCSIEVVACYRMVEDMTTRTMELTSPLIPNGSHWRLPNPDWVHQQQQAAKTRFKSVPWWQRVVTAPARLLGIVDDGLQASDEPNQGDLMICVG